MGDGWHSVADQLLSTTDGLPSMFDHAWSMGDGWHSVADQMFFVDPMDSMDAFTYFCMYPMDLIGSHGSHGIDVTCIDVTWIIDGPWTMSATIYLFLSEIP